VKYKEHDLARRCIAVTNHSAISCLSKNTPKGQLFLQLLTWNRKAK